MWTARCGKIGESGAQGHPLEIIKSFKEPNSLSINALCTAHRPDRDEEGLNVAAHVASAEAHNPRETSIDDSEIFSATGTIAAKVFSQIGYF
jgi:hypothetical protein